MFNFQPFCAKPGCHQKYPLLIFWRKINLKNLFQEKNFKFVRSFVPWVEGGAKT